MTKRTIVIGAGANELVAAHLLARAGQSVALLDPAESGADGAAESGWVAPQVLQALGLEPQRLEPQRADPWIAAPVASGECLELWNDVARSAESIRRFSANDAARWPEFCDRMARLARALEAIAMAPAPDPVGEGFDAIVESLGAALRVRRVVGPGLEDLLRLLPMPVADFLDDWFECDALKGALGAAGILHLRQGPRSGGTTLNFLQHHVGCAPGVFRPSLSNFRSVLQQLPGIEIRHGAPVARITIRDGRVAGVVLANGEEMAASLAVSGIDPRRTLLEFVEPVWLEPESARTLRGIRSRGAVAQVTLELDRDPGFSTLAIAPSLDYLERAYDDVKYGRVSREPYLEARVAGREVRVHVQYVPNQAVEREALADLIVRMLDSHVPGLGGSVTGKNVRLPSDLEKSFGWPEGQMHHAEPALDQWLWMRPTPELARYRTPIAGLYLCGPAMHPGGWMPGACGYHAAGQVLKDRRAGN